MKPVVIAGVQSPGLLGRLRLSDAWDLCVHPLGETMGSWPEGVPDYDGSTKPAMVLVASAKQLRTAKSMFPSTRIVQVAHQGCFKRLPVWYEAEYIVTFSERNRSQLAQYLGDRARVWTVKPYFEPNPVWGWKSNTFWTMLSNPSVRLPASWSGVEEVLKLAPSISHTWYGVGWPAGPLGNVTKPQVMGACSAYLTVLPPRSGIGLAEHECMAAGVPLIGSHFADVATDAPNLTWDYWDFHYMVDDAIRAASDESFARTLSRIGLDYIGSVCTKPRMDSDIHRLLDECPPNRWPRSMEASWNRRDENGKVIAGTIRR